MNEHLGPMDEFIAANSGLVHHVARRYALAGARLGLEYEDIAQEGFIGLIKAYNRFDDTLGYTFSTYAVPYIFGAIRLLLQNYGLVQACRPEKEIAQRIYKAGLDDQSAAEVAEQLGCTVKQAERALSYRHTTVISTDCPISIKDGQAALHELLPDYDDQTGVLVDEFISKLTAKQANVLRLRMQGKRQVDIARFIGTSQSQVGRYLERIGKEYLRGVDKDVV